MAVTDKFKRVRPDRMVEKFVFSPNVKVVLVRSPYGLVNASEVHQFWEGTCYGLITPCKFRKKNEGKRRKKKEKEEKENESEK